MRTNCSWATPMFVAAFTVLAVASPVAQRATYKPKSGDFVVVCTLFKGRAPGATAATPQEPITYDPRFEVGARIERVALGNSPWRAGSLVTFFIHSPSLLLRGNYSGQQFALTFSRFRATTDSDKVWFKPGTRYVLQGIEPVKVQP
jgi:hypothetical protein